MMEQILAILSNPPGQATTAAILAFGLVGVMRGLRHPFYAAHIALMVVVCWAYGLMRGDAAMLSGTAIKHVLVAHLIIINILTYLLYAHDKRAAMKGNWRVPERVLLAFAFIGGTPAAWYAQKKLRHKTSKRGFRSVWWLMLVLQLTLLCWLFILTR